MIMGKLTKGLFPLNVLLLLGLFACTTATDAGTNDPKFHLVYLVSTDKVEPGAKAFVEPLFFTDGNRLLFAYHYCRQYYLTKYNIKHPLYGIPKAEMLSPEEIADDLSAIHEYCENKNATIEVKNYLVRDGSGIRLNLDAVRFVPKKEFRPPDALPDRGSATILAVEGTPLIDPQTTIKGGQQYFFLMTSNPALLDRIAPAQEVNKQKARHLRERVRRYTQARTTGTDQPATMDICEIKSITTPPGQRPFIPPRKGPYSLTRAQTLASLFGDLDGDNLTDLVVSIFEEYPRDRKKFRFDARTTEIRFFYGNGKEQCLVWDDHVAALFHHLYLPLGLIEVGNCRYLISPMMASANRLDLINLSDTTKGCKNLITYKYREYPP